MPKKKKSSGKSPGRPKMPNTGEIQKKIIELIESGEYTKKSICVAVGIHYSTYLDWQIVYPEFSERIKKADAVARENLGELAQTALHKSIAGHFVTEINKKHGIGQRGRIDMTEEIQRYIPPSVTAAIFALTNIKKEHFKHKIEADIKAELTPETYESAREEIKKLMTELKI